MLTEAIYAGLFIISTRACGPWSVLVPTHLGKADKLADMPPKINLILNEIKMIALSKC